MTGWAVAAAMAGWLVGAEAGWMDMFDGRDLTGWDGEPGWWRVEDGCVTAESTVEKPCLKHTYLIWQGGEPGDFELQFEYRIEGGNSGVQFRSAALPGWDMSGYQADIEDGVEWTGALFEHRRGGLALRGQRSEIGVDGVKATTVFADAADWMKWVKPREWNAYRVVARGPDIRLFVNGVLMAQAIDRQAGAAAARGRIGLQMHPGPPMKVQFRRMRLRELGPPAEATPAEQLTVLPGFRAERVYSPVTETEGSWVSLTVDPKGRLYASGQYDEGVYRLKPPEPGLDAGRTRVERLPVALSGAQGMCWAFGALYAVVSENGATPSGLYRVRDTDGDDVLDGVECLRLLEGGGDHGWHGVVPGPDGASLYVVAGNNTRGPALRGSRVPPHFGEDQLLPRLPDAGGHMKDVLAPGGVMYRVSPDGREWERVANGFRNPYDAAFDRDGELFTYDADMEWDMGTPWYRPTRICHVVSGAEFGWRHGSGKWPARFPDSVPAVHDMGPGSPTGVVFGYGAAFPPKYESALFAGDWTFGRIYAVHLEPEGASYRAASEVFVSGVPLPVVDMVVHPDGALYFLTGGWRSQTGLYRVTHDPAAAAAPVATGATTATSPAPAAGEARATRRRLEEWHGRAGAGAVDQIWPRLGDADRSVRFAARVALEWQPPEAWSDRAVRERDPATALGALLALARVSGRDPPHRPPGAGPPDATVRARPLEALASLDWDQLTGTQRTDWLRALAVTMTRLGPPVDAEQARWRSLLEPRFPSGDRAVDADLVELLAYLNAPGVVPGALAALRAAPSQEDQMHFAKALRGVTAGWTPERRRDYFSWFHTAAGYRGGASFAGFLAMIKADALAVLPPEARAPLTPILDAPPPPSPFAAFGADLAGRTAVGKWTVADLAPALERGLGDRDRDRGRRLFGATGCFVCHRVDGEGGAVGPDLTRLAGRFSPRDALEATLDPNRAISDLYGNVTVTLNSGETLTGRIVYHLHGDVMNLSPDMFSPATTIQVPRRNVRSIERSPVSPMPPGLLDRLTEDEILDLLAFLLGEGR
jgi:putative heme-binding domain-containing protein